MPQPKALKLNDFKMTMLSTVQVGNANFEMK